VPVGPDFLLQGALKMLPHQLHGAAVGNWLFQQVQVADARAVQRCGQCRECLQSPSSKSRPEHFDHARSGAPRSPADALILPGALPSRN
jgi:hypothetical protein